MAALWMGGYFSFGSGSAGKDDVLVIAAKTLRDQLNRGPARHSPERMAPTGSTTETAERRTVKPANHQCYGVEVAVSDPQDEFQAEKL